MVGDDHIGLGQLGACRVVTAFAVTRAMAGGTGMALCGYGGPVAWIRRIVEAIAVAVPACVGQQVGHVFVHPSAAFF